MRRDKAARLNREEAAVRAVKMDEWLKQPTVPEDEGDDPAEDADTSMNCSQMMLVTLRPMLSMQVASREAVANINAQVDVCH